ncbi:MAG TPA: glucose-6-phosphate isomerase [Candidatus Moranbacteria bacterium]|nr:glucose-6-phosphate isomerase [Candidatus Moranbacteria bacterium]
MENVNKVPDIRRRQDMKDVLYNPEASGEDELYYMYRGVSYAKDEALIENKGLRYDITVICPGTLEREYIKTAGHYHPEKPGTGLTYPEVYEVLHGRAHYLLQRPHPEDIDSLETVLLVAAKPGDKVLIPPGFGHITINPGEDFLIMSNWVARDFSSVYEPVRQMAGGGYYELQTEEGPEFVVNKRYRSVPALRRCPVIQVPQLNLITGLPLYRVFLENSRAFEFLTVPEQYTDLFANYLEELTVT